MLIVSPLSIAFSDHHLFPRTTIFFSPSSRALSFRSHWSIFLVFFDTLCSFLRISSPTMWVILSTNALATRVHVLILLLFPPDYWYTSFFRLAGPGPLREIAVSALSSSPSGRVYTDQFLYILLISRISLNLLPLPPQFCTLLVIYPSSRPLC